MAEAVVKDQDPFRCSICLDLVKDPVTIACGHSYCMKCINGCWDEESQKGEYSCPQCRETFSPRPVLKKSTMLAELVDKMNNSRVQTASPPPATYAEDAVNVECDFCSERKVKAVQSCLVCLISFCQTHIEPHYSIPALKKHKLVHASTHLQEKICSKHDKLIEVFCRTDKKFICMLCIMDEHKGHDTVSAAAERKEREKELERTTKNLLTRIQKKEEELWHLRKAMASYQRSAQEREEQSEKICTGLLESIERRLSEVKDVIRAQQKAAVKDAEDVLEKLEQELAELRREDAELEKLSLEEDHVHFLQSFQAHQSSVSKTSPAILLSPYKSFEVLGKSLSALKSEMEEVCKQNIMKISQEVTQDVLFFSSTPDSCRLTLDPNMAHRLISLSEGNKRATYNYTLSRSERLEKCAQVLCEQSFCRRVYWEAELKLNGYSLVGIAVAYKSIAREYDGAQCLFENVKKKPWCLQCGIGEGFFWWQDGGKSSKLSIPTSRIGVYVDHRAGTLSFYNVSDQMTPIYSIQTTFTEPICPVFYVGPGDSVKLCCEV
ncbi:hypothetical protein ACEWY4_016471 [Coilia grayii]|uniref:Uncharacterized protein n=1 Tax=Coilia grayii TaxID=363190 RepID=A0ABD1JKF7_9TELE